MTEIRPADRWIYIGFLALLVWIPLPLGSNRVWAWSLLEVWVYLLVIFWVQAFVRQRVCITPVFRAATPVVLILCLWLLYVFLQTLPFPADWVAVLSPQAAYIHSLSPRPQDWITFSVNPYATQQGFLKSLAYISCFCLTLLLINSRQRLKALSN